MCGIVGYIGERDATPIILKGLKRLEYRGYDSAGVAVLANGQIEIRRDAGKLSQLEALVNDMPVHGKIGIGHTRWATHGEPNARNAHPHIGSTGEFVVVHNGIVENYLALREELIAEGTQFKSETDTETIVHLIEKFYASGDGLVEAVRKTLKQLKGAHGIVVMSSREPDKIVAARIGNAGGVVIGLGKGENFIASDLPAILEHTRQVVFLESLQMAVVTKDDYTVTDIQGNSIHTPVQTISWDPVAAEKGEYRHFMQKEIHEQVRSITDTLAGRVDFDSGKVILHDLNLNAERARQINKIIITACGTAAHAGMVGKILIEKSLVCQPRLPSHRNFATLTPWLVKIQSFWRSANPAKLLTPWQRWRKVVHGVQFYGRMSMLSAHRQCGLRMDVSRCRLGLKSALPPQKLSPRRCWTCICWQFTWVSYAVF
jgi:glutamine---fructose-6-phosphate transaminase (isomerizing)